MSLRPVSLRLHHVENKVVYIVGLGKTGYQSAKTLQSSGADVILWDDNMHQRNASKDLNLPFSPPEAVEWSKVDSLLLSPGIAHLPPLAHQAAILASAHKVEIICDVELFVRQFPTAKLLAITGTNGKSTASALLYHVLKTAEKKVQIGGNFGIPILALQPPTEDSYVVVELSSYQLERIPSLKAHIAILMNIAPDHLARHGNMAGYVNAKAHIFAHQNADDFAIVGMDDPHTKHLFQSLSKRPTPCLTVGRDPTLTHGVIIEKGRLLDRINPPYGENTTLALDEMPALVGAHNHQNAAIVYAACKCLGMARKPIEHGLKDFTGLAHRQQKIAILDGISFVNDSKATNVDATARALASYGSIYWLAGGQEKENTYEPLDKMLVNVKKAYFFGHAKSNMARYFHGKIPTMCFERLEQALAMATEDAKASGDKDPVVLLSPACASWDQYENFEARGTAFTKQVKLLPSQQRQILA